MGRRGPSPATDLQRAQPGLPNAKGHGSFDPWPLRFASPRAVPARGIRRRLTSRMLRAELGVPAESGPAAIPATSCTSRRGVYGAAPARSSARAAAARALRRRSEHERFHRDEVVEHRLACGVAVAARDCLHDAPVVLVRAAWPAGRVDGLLAAL